MCSIGMDEDDFMIEANEDDDSGVSAPPCKKCKSLDIAVKLRGSDHYCKACFLVSFNHKFRSSLGKSKKFKPNDHVLVALSDDCNSVALLQLVISGLTDNQHKKLLICPIFVLMDDSWIKPTQEKYEICEKVEASGYKCYKGSLEDILEEPSKRGSNLIDRDINENLRQKLRVMLDSSQSSEEDLFRITRMNLLVIYAEILAATKVLLPENSLDVAVNSLSSIALGRGINLPQFTHSQTEIRGISFHRPMKDMSCEEIQYYLNMNGYDCSQQQSFSQDSGIGSLTRQFIEKLQSGFPATVPTICKMSDKIDSSLVVSGNNKETCELCWMSFDPPTNASEAKRISQELSSSKPIPGDVYCYACKNIITDSETEINNEDIDFKQLHNQD